MPPKVPRGPPKLQIHRPGRTARSDVLRPAPRVPQLVANTAPRLPERPPGLPTNPPRIHINSPGMVTQPPRLVTNPPRMHINPPGMITNPPGMITKPPGVPIRPPGMPTNIPRMMPLRVHSSILRPNPTPPQTLPQPEVKVDVGLAVNESSSSHSQPVLAEAVLRTTTSLLPRCAEKGSAVGVPLGFVYRPFVAVNAPIPQESDSKIGESRQTQAYLWTPPQCVECGGFLNTHCAINASSHQWVCSLCSRRNVFVPMSPDPSVYTKLPYMQSSDMLYRLPKPNTDNSSKPVPKQFRIGALNVIVLDNSSCDYVQRLHVFAAVCSVIDATRASCASSVPWVLLIFLDVDTGTVEVFDSFSLFQSSQTSLPAQGWSALAPKSRTLNAPVNANVLPGSECPHANALRAFFSVNHVTPQSLKVVFASEVNGKNIDNGDVLSARVEYLAKCGFFPLLSARHTCILKQLVFTSLLKLPDAHRQATSKIGARRATGVAMYAIVSLLQSIRMVCQNLALCGSLYRNTADMPELPPTKILMMVGGGCTSGIGKCAPNVDVPGEVAMWFDVPLILGKKGPSKFALPALVARQTNAESRARMHMLHSMSTLFWANLRARLRCACAQVFTFFWVPTPLSAPCSKCPDTGLVGAARAHFKAVQELHAQMGVWCEGAGVCSCDEHTPVQNIPYHPILGLASFTHLFKSRCADFSALAPVNLSQSDMLGLGNEHGHIYPTSRLLPAEMWSQSAPAMRLMPVCDKSPDTSAPPRTLLCLPSQANQYWQQPWQCGGQVYFYNPAADSGQASSLQRFRRDISLIFAAPVVGGGVCSITVGVDTEQREAVVLEKLSGDLMAVLPSSMPLPWDKVPENDFSHPNLPLSSATSQTRSCFLAGSRRAVFLPSNCAPSHTLTAHLAIHDDLVEDDVNVQCVSSWLRWDAEKVYWKRYVHVHTVSYVVSNNTKRLVDCVRDVGVGGMLTTANVLAPTLPHGEALSNALSKVFGASTGQQRWFELSGWSCGHKCATCLTHSAALNVGLDVNVVPSSVQLRTSTTSTVEEMKQTLSRVRRDRHDLIRRSATLNTRAFVKRTIVNAQVAGRSGLVCSLLWIRANDHRHTLVRCVECVKSSSTIPAFNAWNPPVLHHVNVVIDRHSRLFKRSLPELNHQLDEGVADNVPLSGTIVSSPLSLSRSEVQGSEGGSTTREDVSIGASIMLDSGLNVVATNALDTPHSEEKQHNMLTEFRNLCANAWSNETTTKLDNVDLAGDWRSELSNMYIHTLQSIRRNTPTSHHLVQRVSTESRNSTQQRLVRLCSVYNSRTAGHLDGYFMPNRYSLLSRPHLYHLDAVLPSGEMDIDSDVKNVSVHCSGDCSGMSDWPRLLGHIDTTGAPSSGSESTVAAITTTSFSNQSTPEPRRYVGSYGDAMAGRVRSALDKEARLCLQRFGSVTTISHVLWLVADVGIVQDTVYKLLQSADVALSEDKSEHKSVEQLSVFERISVRLARLISQRFTVAGNKTTPRQSTAHHSPRAQNGRWLCEMVGCVADAVENRFRRECMKYVDATVRGDKPDAEWAKFVLRRVWHAQDGAISSHSDVTGEFDGYVSAFNVIIKLVTSRVCATAEGKRNHQTASNATNTASVHTDAISATNTANVHTDAISVDDSLYGVTGGVPWTPDMSPDMSHRSACSTRQVMRVNVNSAHHSYCRLLFGLQRSVLVDFEPAGVLQATHHLPTVQNDFINVDADSHFSRQILCLRSRITSCSEFMLWVRINALHGGMHQSVSQFVLGHSNDNHALYTRQIRDDLLPLRAPRVISYGKSSLFAAVHTRNDGDDSWMRAMLQRGCVLASAPESLLPDCVTIVDAGYMVWVVVGSALTKIIDSSHQSGANNRIKSDDFEAILGGLVAYVSMHAPFVRVLRLERQKDDDFSSLMCVVHSLGRADYRMSLVTRLRSVQPSLRIRLVYLRSYMQAILHNTHLLSQVSANVSFSVHSDALITNRKTVKCACLCREATRNKWVFPCILCVISGMRLPCVRVRRLNIMQNESFHEYLERIGNVE